MIRHTCSPGVPPCGCADLNAWGATDLSPTGEDNSEKAVAGRRRGTNATPPPSAATVATMRRDAFLQMDYLVYDAAVQRLRCQLATCGLPPLPDEAHDEAQQHMQQQSGGGGGGTSTRGAGAASRRARRRARKLRGRLSVMQSK